MSNAPPNPQLIFTQALEIPAGSERTAYLEQACGGDVALLTRVKELLAAHDNAGAFLKSGPAFSETGTYKPEQHKPEVKTEIGPYKLLQQIGEGGMGVVYMAEQKQPVQRLVALKIIKPGMDSRQVITRFEAERQALALMDHPNIAKVLDAGTTKDGLPYFVMELVKGVPITKYCDDNHLTLRQRLELFIPVCHAVQHAHHKGIIHRDLKPSNVMVAQFDGTPVPKVIDFGVAKATGQKLTEQTMYTEFGAIIGTLEYMSPEQAEFNQLDIDTRSDVYSLGVLMYELLTGSTPFDKKRLKNAALLEILRLIREEEPQRPSTRLNTTQELPSIAANRGLEPRRLSGLIRGDLDWIVMKALEKNRVRRYETANGLANDIQRYLTDEPVSACPPSMLYRFKKLGRRHKSLFALAGIGLSALVVGVIGLAISNRLISRERDITADALRAEATALKSAQEAQAQESQLRKLADTRRAEAERERDRADRNYVTARDAVDRLLTRVSDGLRGQPKLEQMRRELLEDALKFYQGFVREKNADLSVRVENGRAYLRVAELHCLLGRLTDGIRNYDAAVKIFSDLAAEHPDTPNHREQLAQCHSRYALALHSLYRRDEAVRQKERSIAIWEALKQDFPDNPNHIQELATSEAELGHFYIARYRHGVAQRHFDRSQKLIQELTERFPKFKWTAGEGRAVPSEGVDLNEPATLPELRDYTKLTHDMPTLQLYEQELRQSVAYREKQAQAHPDALPYRTAFLFSITSLAQVLLAQDRFDELDRILWRIVDEYQQIVVQFPENKEQRVGSAWADFSYAHYLCHAGRRTEAVTYARRAIETNSKLVEAYPGEGRHLIHMLGLLIHCPIPELRDPPRAIRVARQCIDIANYPSLWIELAYAQIHAGQYAEALQSLAEAKKPGIAIPELDLVESIALWNTGKTEEAKQLYLRGKAVIDKTENKLWRTLAYRNASAEIDKLMGLAPEQPAAGNVPAKP